MASANGLMLLEVSETMVSHVTDSPARRTTVSGGWYGWYTGFTFDPAFDDAVFETKWSLTVRLQGTWLMIARLDSQRSRKA